jgi:chromate transporter
MNGSLLFDLASYFAVLSLISFGGVSASLPDIHRYFVDEQHWMSSEEFTRLFGIANAAPGPNMMVVGVLGYQVAGVMGAIVSFVAMALPSAVMAYYLGGVWQRFRDRPWRIAIQSGLTPLTVGLLLASGTVLTLAADDNSWVAYAVTGGTVAVFLFTRVHPLWCLGAGALLGACGWV